MSSGGPAIWITGVGVVSPGGWSAAETWETVAGGKSAIRWLERFPLSGAATRAGGAVPGLEHELPPESLALRFAQHAVDEAMAHAGLAPGDINAIVVGNHGERSLPQADNSSLIITAAELTSRLQRQTGATRTASVYGACAGGSLAIGAGYNLLRSGAADTVIVGGSDCLLREFDFFQFCNLYAMSVRDCEPARGFVSFRQPT